MTYVLSYNIENSNTIFDSPAIEPESHFPNIRPTEDYIFNIQFSVFDNEANTNIDNANVNITSTEETVEIISLSNNEFQISVSNNENIELKTDLYRFIQFTENFQSFEINDKFANTVTEDDSVIEWLLTNENLEYTVSIHLSNNEITEQTYIQEYIFPDFVPDTNTLLDLVARSKL